MTTQPISFSQSASDVGREKKTDKLAKSSAGAQPHLAGMLWFAGWLFTIGFAKLVWWKVIIGLVVWPYFVGQLLR